ncbi:hypothetical protein [Thalassotalea sp. SU-HH00458]|uniref:hypothetical protein n=1 Tax=Thalassotalea sp. SU-HH00458 TaxID=3127657 RepID=UPI003108625A
MSRSDIFRALITLLTLAICLTFSVVSRQSVAVEQTIKIPQQRSTFDISHDYHKQLLKMALDKAAEGRKIPEILDTIKMSQGRAIVELKKGENLDVYWLGSSKSLEKDLLAIKIPTTRGLIGYRKFTIHQDSVASFDQIKTIDELKKFSACQGAHWPDTKILRAADLLVTTSTHYEDIFNMLNHKRCDYFPRSFHDSLTELALRAQMYPDLINYQDIILHYPFAVYFFTSKANVELARWIEKGLILLAENGEIEKLMQTHPLTANVYPFKDEHRTVYFELPNDFLELGETANNPDYWILPKDFNLNTLEN